MTGGSGNWGHAVTAFLLLLMLTGAPCAMAGLPEARALIERRIIMDYAVDNDLKCSDAGATLFRNSPVAAKYVQAAKFVLDQAPEVPDIIAGIKASCNSTADGQKRIRVVIRTAPAAIKTAMVVIDVLRSAGYAKAAKVTYELLGAAYEDWWPCTMTYDVYSGYKSVCVAKTSCAHPNSKWQSLTASDTDSLFEMDGYCMPPGALFMNLKNSFPRNRITATWSDAVPICQWSGIQCNSNGDVIKLDLGGVLVGDISQLAGIKWPSTILGLNFSGDPNKGMQLYGSIPPGMSAPLSLQNISFANNQITGGLLNLAVAAPPTIRNIDISNNRLALSSSELTYSNMMAAVPKIKNLKNVDFSNNPTLNSDGVPANETTTIVLGPRENAARFAFNNYMTYPWNAPPRPSMRATGRRHLLQATNNDKNNPFLPMFADGDSCLEESKLASIGIAGGIDGVRMPDCTRILDVSNNKLTKLNMRFSPDSQLRILKAEGNVITNISALILARSGPVEELNLRDNLLVEMPSAWNTKLSTKLRKVDLRDNPLTGTLQSWTDIPYAEVWLSKSAADEMCVQGGKNPISPKYVVYNGEKVIDTYTFKSCGGGGGGGAGSCSTSNPCNGGTCVPDNTDPRGFRCTCPYGYTGDYCETQCQILPCP